MVELLGVLIIAPATITMDLYGAISVLVAMIFQQMNTSRMKLIVMSPVLVIQMCHVVVQTTPSISMKLMELLGLFQLLNP